MANVRLLSFSYVYSIIESDKPGAEIPAEIERAIQQNKLADGVTAPTPVPQADRKVGSNESSKSIPLRDIERVLPIYLRVYFKEDGKTKRALIEYEVKNNETLLDMLSVMLRKLKTLKGKTEAKGRMYYTQRKFRNPAELDFKNYGKIVIEDLAEMGKSMFFVFDMAGRLDRVSTDDHMLQWVVPLQK
ncbi:hypothetical protein DICVIV_00142 [Dictyocaulus viviparus]|uniref:Uncharacterized protein n=1 Tax=Dictyocaulus viviparus TaxID=29172 RepID=A0A0D8YA79_DICVI|nr:hypothetical protein DICVIV_00142 [Dictyocaulus viviparus]